MTRRAKVLCGVDTVLWPEVLDPLRQVADVEDLIDRTSTGLRKQISDVDAYIPSLNVRVDHQILDAAKRLSIIYTPSTGTDHLDLAEIEKRGIGWYSLKNEREFLDGVTATAELAFALMLAVFRKLPAAAAAARSGHWARDVFRGHQVSGKTLGILGVGRLGTMMANYGRAFRMTVIGCDPSYADHAPPCTLVDFDTLLRESDVLSIHIHLTPQNRGLIGGQAIGKMKQGVVIINTSRGAVIDETALLEALRSGQVAGAGLDVIDGEWRDDLAEHPLIRHSRDNENLIIVPHVGGVTYESQSAGIRFVADKLAALLSERGSNQNGALPSSNTVLPTIDNPRR